MKVPYKDSQMQLGFIVYMIAGSYFGKTVCRTPRMAEKMHLYYNTMLPASQVDMETLCERFIQRELLPAIPAQMVQGRVDAFLLRDVGRPGRTGIFFTDGFSVIEISAEQSGRKTRFRMMLCMNKDAYDDGDAAASPQNINTE